MMSTGKIKPLHTVSLWPDGGQSRDFIKLSIFKTTRQLEAALPKGSVNGNQWMIDEGVVEDGKTEACFLTTPQQPDVGTGAECGSIFIAVDITQGVIVHECTHAGLFYAGLVADKNAEKGAYGDPPDGCKQYEHFSETCAVVVQTLYDQINEALKLVKA